MLLILVDMNKMNHHYAVILSADVVGFSKLMEGDGEATVRALDECRQHFRRCVTVHHGQEFGSVGDSFMAEFSSPVEALRAASELQREVGDEAITKDKQPRLSLRVGLDAGDVISNDKGVFGDVVNAAARLQQLAKPDGIVLSESVHQQVHKLPGYQFHSLGKQHLKNILEPVRVFEVNRNPALVNWRRMYLVLSKYSVAAAVIAGIAFAAAFIFIYLESHQLGSSRVVRVQAEDSWGTTDSTSKSIAVLPLVSLGSDSAQNYLADSMTDVLTAELGQIKSLRVISRTSAKSYAGAKKRVPEIARELKADTIVEGSVHSLGDKVRITMQLIDGRTDEHLWSRSYHRDLADILTLQGEIARTIADEIHVTLTPQVSSRLTRDRSMDPEILRLWAVATNDLKSGDEDDYQQALTGFVEISSRDPYYAPAYAGMAQAYVLLAGWSGTQDPKHLLPLAKLAAEKAIQLDPGLANAHFSLASVYWADWRWEEANAEFRKGMDLSPSDSVGLVEYASFLTSTGRAAEAVTLATLAVDLDPVSSYTNNELGFALCALGRYEEALRVYEMSVRLDPDDGINRDLLAWIYYRMGEREKSLQIYEQQASQFEEASSFYYPYLANIYVSMGRTKDVRGLLTALERRSEHDYVPALTFAKIHTYLSEFETAIEWFVLAHVERDREMLWDWNYEDALFPDEIRQDPRIQSIIADLEQSRIEPEPLL